MFVMLHMSDLHIGDRIKWRGTAHYAQPGRTPPPLPLLHGQHGHDELVAWHLTNEWAQLLDTWPETKVVVSGDLTRTGVGEEYGLAHRFIHAYWLWYPPSPFWYGLGQGGRSPVSQGGSPTGFAWLGPDQKGYLAPTIPGNHDYWGGGWKMARVNRAVLEPHFWPLPWLYPYEDSTKKYEIHLVGLDSCSGLAGLAWNQFWAKGAIDSNCIKKAAVLFANAKASAKRPVLRVVTVHHPPEKLVDWSRQEFATWLENNNVHVILTGHTHIPSPQLDAQGQTKPAASSLVGGTTATYEMRCGTTLQAGTATHLPGPSPNHFFVHSLSPTLAGKALRVEWVTESYEHNGIKWMRTGTVFQHLLAPI